MLPPVRYLSPEWIAAAGRAVAGDDRLRAALAGVALVVEQRVTGGPGDVVWHLTIGPDGVALCPGPADPDRPADLRLTTDYATAAAVASGTIGAQRAFVEGRLRVGGDLSLLMAHQRALAAVDDALAPVRARTTYP
jgi:SCP-2 sterol transfer family